MAIERARSAAPSTQRLSGAFDELKTSFGLPSAVAMLAGLVVGFGLPAIDDLLDVSIPTFAFETQDAARGLLETIATVTVAVAGLAFSVTIVAFTLSSSQLSPRVLRSFRGDRLSQAVLAMFLGTFIYCLAVLIRLGATNDQAAVPNLSITLAIVLAFVSFALFAAFIAHIASMLQPSSVISGITADARGALEQRYPAGIGEEPDDRRRAEALAHTRIREAAAAEVRAEGEGYLTLVRGEAVMSAASSSDALVSQRLTVGDYVVPGDVLAQVWASDDGADELASAVGNAFELGSQRSLVQDVAFSVRQLSDIALKGLSPGINDPTTAENAMSAMAAVLIRFARSEAPGEVRVDAEGTPRFVARAPSLDDLVELGFDQVRVFAAPYPVISKRLLELLDRIHAAAEQAGTEAGETRRQAKLIDESVEGELPTESDADEVKRERVRLHRPRML